MATSFDKLLQQLQCQFLCCYPIHCIDWQVSKNPSPQIPLDLTWEQQQQLIDSTANHPLNRAYPVKVAYQLNFLKRLLQLLEKHLTEVHDAIYESYCAVQQCVAQDATQKYAYKHYLLPAWNAQFTLRESKSFVAAGTTGLCSWQASLALADYLLQHVNIVKDKAVLELGAGTGLCGLLLVGCCGAKQVLLTDGSQPCVQLMRENVLRNFSNAKETTPCTFVISQQMLSVGQLAWGEIAATQLLRNLKPDVLLAADVVYDDSVFSELSHALDYVFNSCENACSMLLAATVRNEQTLKKFLELLANLKFEIEEKSVVPLEQSYLYWDRTTPVKILKITRDR